MSQTLSIRQVAVRSCLVLPNTDWRTYSRLLRVFDGRPGVRLTYDRGELEIMLPLMEHDGDGRFIGDMVYVLTDELGLPLKRGGSATLRRKLKQRGIESDECFWIANAHRMAGKRRLDLRADPPPDLAIDIDVTHSLLNCSAIHAALGVPEVWRVDGNTMSFYALGTDRTYTTAVVSPTFPLMRPADLIGFLQQGRIAVDENAVLRQFRTWIRQQADSAGAAPAP